MLSWVSLLERISAYKVRIDFFLSTLEKEGEQVSGRMFLFVGCGSGLEAICLKQEIPDSLVVGTDVDRNAFVKEVRNDVDLVVCDSSVLPFKGKIFDFCYCYHVLEHMADHQKGIEEMKKTLKSDGGLFLATPNRRRLMGYILSAQKASLYEVVSRNLREWLARFRGNFIPGKRHCGFYEEELWILLNSCFPRVACLTTKYNLYASRNSLFKPLVNLCHKIGILRQLTVSHTFYCQSRARNERVDSKVIKKE